MLALALAAAGFVTQAADSVPTFRADSNLVLVRFQLLPRKGEVLEDLKPEDIEIREDGVPQKPAVFSGGRHAPGSVSQEVMLLFDCSGTVRRAGILPLGVFHENLLDEYENASIAIYGFSEDCYRLTGPTRDAAVLKKAMEGLLAVPSSTTPLFKHIENVLKEAAATRSNAARTLVVFSDGVSTSGKETTEDIIELARDSGIAICPVILPNPAVDPEEIRRSMTARGPLAGARVSVQVRIPSMARFEALGGATGGEKFNMRTEEDPLASVLKHIARRFAHDYVTGYHPSTSGEAKRHRVQVVLRSKLGKIAGGSRTVTH